MLRIRLASMVSLAAMVLAACGSAATTPSTTVAADDARATADGVVVAIEDTSRIVSLNGDLTEIIFALGAGDRVVGVDLTTTFPPDAVTLPDVGLGRDLNAEQVIGLEPTLVIGDEQVQPEAAIDQIRRAGIPVIILPTVVALEGVPRKIHNVGTILGLDDEAHTLALQVQSEIDEAVALASQATSTPRVAYMYVRGPETLLLFGNGMPTHFLIEAANAVDAAGEVGVLFAEDLSAERLVTASPEILLTPTAGFDIIGGLEPFLALPGVADTPAGANRRVIAYDEALLLGMGPRVGAALRQLVIDLHPEIDG
ncbi:MAG: heme/hemin ABC transporter substrate-binding protein [Acidimicrobiia bacterium]